MKQYPLAEPCKRCNTVSWERLPRRTLFERHVWPQLGLYPWRCCICNKRSLFKLRSDRRRIKRER